MRAFILVMSLVLAACAGKSVNERQRAVYNLQIGSGHLAKGNYPGALAEFIKAHELDPDNPLVHNQLGLGYFLRGRMEQAEKHFREALGLNPKFTEARNNLGRTYIELKRYKEAISELRVAAKDLIYSEPEKTYANLGLAYFYLADYANAEKSFLQSLKMRRKNCLALNFYGRTLYEQSAFDKAAESLDQAMQECKSLKLEDPYYFAALSYMKTGDRDQAVARLEEGLSAYPDGSYAAKARSMLELLK